jgi:thiol:disulfide interchange protein
MTQPNHSTSSFPHWLAALALLLAACLAPPAQAQETSPTPAAASAPATQPAPKKFNDSRKHVRLSALPWSASALPGSIMPVAVIFDHDQGWHIHTSDPVVPKSLADVTIFKTQISPAAEKAGASSPFEPIIANIQWPKTHTITIEMGDTPEPYTVYDGRAIAYVPVKIAKDTKPGDYNLTLLVTFQACDATSCLAPARNIPVTVPIRIDDPSIKTGIQIAGGPDFEGMSDNVLSGAKPSTISSQPAPGSAQTPQPSSSANTTIGAFGLDFTLDPTSALGFISLLALAFIGGIILNFTPCVLPVIPLKIMSLEKHASEQGGGSRNLLLGLVMAGGVVFFWLVLGIAIAGLAVLTSTNQLFQYPWFTIGVGVVIAVMAIAMTGLFLINLPAGVYNFAPKLDSIHGAFGFGIMTAVLSTPCTGPFMGSAAAAGATLGPARALLVFVVIGAGMASPYLALSAFPALAKKMPKAGPGSETLKQVLGLLMLAAAAFFIGTGVSGLLVKPPAPAPIGYWWAVAGLVAAAGLWTLIQTLRLARKSTTKALLSLLGVLTIVGAVYMGYALTRPGPISWVYYTPQVLNETQTSRKPVMIEFTAEWCINCKVLEKTVLHSDTVLNALKKSGVVPMKVDLTGNNDQGNELLNAYGRVTIPFLIVLDKQGKPVFQSDAYTPGDLAAALEKAGQ